MSSLYLFQFAALVFMLVNALFVALARLNARWKNKRYERSRLMIFLALVLLSAQYYIQMRFHIRATDDHLGAMVNMLVYTPCFGLIAMAIYNLEAVQAKRRNMALACAGFYAAIVGCFALGHYLRGSWHIGGWLYPMLALYSVHMIYCVLMIRKETHKRRRMLETLTATDLLPYVRYSYASVVNLCLAALVTPVAILSTTTLLYLWPLGTDGHSFLRSYVHLFGYGLYAVRRTAGLGGGRTGGGIGDRSLPPAFRYICQC